MFKQRKWLVALIALVVISLVFGIGQVMADGPTSEPDPVVPNNNPANSAVDPEVVDAVSIPAAPPQEIQPQSGPTDSEGNPLAEAAVSTSYPDLVEETEPLAPSATNATTYFRRYAGIAFQPRDSDTGYDYFGVGCISSKGADYFVLDMQLPTGAVIDFVRFYYYDTSTANARMYLTWYDGAGGYDDVMYVDSSGTSGYGSAGAFTDYTVDPINQAISLVWRPNTTGSSMALCGARVRIQVPFGIAFLPNIVRESAP